ncbi:tetratricopeptide repeat protein [Coraliomargarita akajimensis]|uniref:Tetratricopeptide TPR_4 n=1 Tax=Coraliomargarita akajimensis (strain DSM 45221 / IAM 15411 / JCM 23193 / KCTC 12865 / 04OKA010-24) TaxID=583355 RepID=D5ENI2_CORAD|nr:tetratricopeptide repeat protein [Coraliomargarita akajimensis]ADE55458.1 Tetratricopeptide TPR_4 [Coraliomargarita akajimensis DSM 45221]
MWSASNYSALWPLFKILCLLGLCVPSVFLPAQAPLVTEAVVANSPASELLIHLHLEAADRSLMNGLPGIAERLYRKVLADEALSGEVRARTQVQLSAALIAQRRFSEAQSVLSEVDSARQGVRYRLYRAISTYADGSDVDLASLTENLSAVNVELLEPVDRPWFYLMEGLRDELAGNPSDLQAAFTRAQGAAVSDTQAAYFEALVMREKIRQTPADETLAAEVRRQLDSFQGTAAAFPFAREYVIMMYNMGRQAEAESVIDRELNAQSAYGRYERDQLLLLRAMVIGVDTVPGRAALRELIRYGGDRQSMGVALQLLGSGDKFARAELEVFLGEMISRPDPHPLLGQMYYMSSELALERDDMVKAEENAQKVLNQFPGFKQIENVYRLFAYAALLRTPPQYRAAADYLIQMRDRAESDAIRVELNRLIGDCYFLKEDYQDAAEFYRSAYEQSAGEGDDGLFLRMVTAELRAGQTEVALAQVDQADFSNHLSEIDRWKVEWNIAQALQGMGNADQALTRIQLLLEDGATPSIPASMDLRLRWLEARLLLLSGTTEGVEQKVDSLLGRIRSFPEGVLDETEARLLITESLLLKAELLIRSGDADGGRKVLESLRVGYASSAAAERSYLREANFYSAAGNLEAAQQTLLVLADTYSESPLASQAIYEAGLLGERRGVEHYADAVRILSRLAETYPEDALVFPAQLKQADLLRLMNDFSGAQIIYENLINRYPEHPLLYIAMLSRADCMLALARNDLARLEDASLVLERLLDLPGLPLDVQAEAAYKWAFALQRREMWDAAQEVYGLLSDRFLLNAENVVQLGPTGRYWVSRAMLDLGELLQNNGDAEEARRVYRKIIAYNLPGKTMAQMRSDRIQVSDE